MCSYSSTKISIKISDVLDPNSDGYVNDVRVCNPPYNDCEECRGDVRESVSELAVGRWERLCQDARV